MKWTIRMAAVGAMLTLPCCLPIRQPIVTEPVGPEPAAKPTGPVGFLKVYSETDATGADDIMYASHSGYTIYASDGQVFRNVRGSAGAPLLVNLPEGTYRVQARAAFYGTVVVPVVIKEGRTTSIYLEGDWKPDLEGFEQADLVRLPNGTMIGWRSKGPRDSVREGARQPASDAGRR